MSDPTPAEAIQTLAKLLAPQTAASEAIASDIRKLAESLAYVPDKEIAAMVEGDESLLQMIARAENSAVSVVRAFKVFREILTRIHVDNLRRNREADQGADGI